MEPYPKLLRFSRLNSLGKNIKQQDLIYALTYSGSDKNRVNDFINKVKECFANYIEVEKVAVIFISS